MIAQNVTLTGILGDDFKHVLKLEGLNLTGITVTFEASAGPEQPALITSACTLLGVHTDGDGITTSTIQIYVAANTVRTAISTLGGLPANEDLPLFYQLKLASIPGDLGTAALTTVLYGDYIMKGEVNG